MKLLKPNTCILIACLTLPVISFGQQVKPASFSCNQYNGWILIICLMLIAMFITTMILKIKVDDMRAFKKKQRDKDDKLRLKNYIDRLNSNQIDTCIKYFDSKNEKQDKGKRLLTWVSIFFMSVALSLSSNPLFAQDAAKPQVSSLLSETGIIITIVLLLIPITVGIALLAVKVTHS